MDCSSEGCDRPATLRGMCKKHYQVEWQRANPEKVHAYYKKWRNKNLDADLAADAIYRENNRDRLNARDRAKYAANREAAIARVMDWRQRNRQKCADTEARRRARAKAASSVEKIDRDEIIARDRSICHLCGKKVRKADLHLDHIVPLAAGGDHTAANLAVAHQSCNQSKGARAANDQLRLVG